jgi:hypothetical protein
MIRILPFQWGITTPGVSISPQWVWPLAVRPIRIPAPKDGTIVDFGHSEGDT